MMNKRSMLVGALLAPALALTGGIAYASSTAGQLPTRPAVTQVAHPHGQPATGRAGHGYCGWHSGDDRCDWRGHRTQQATRQASHQHHAYQGNQGYQGSGQRGGSGSHHGWGYGDHRWDDQSGRSHHGGGNCR